MAHLVNVRNHNNNLLFLLPMLSTAICQQYIYRKQKIG